MRLNTLLADFLVFVSIFVHSFCSGLHAAVIFLLENSCVRLPRGIWKQSSSFPLESFFSSIWNGLCGKWNSSKVNILTNKYSVFNREIIWYISCYYYHYHKLIFSVLTLTVLLKLKVLPMNFGTNLRHFIRTSFAHLVHTHTQTHKKHSQGWKLPLLNSMQVHMALKHCLPTHIKREFFFFAARTFAASVGTPRDHTRRSTAALFGTATCHLNAALTLFDVFSAAAVTSPPSLLSFSVYRSQHLPFPHLLKTH